MDVIPESVSVERDKAQLVVTVDVKFKTSLYIDTAPAEDMPSVLAATFRAAILRAVDDNILGTIRKEAAETMDGQPLNKQGHVDLKKKPKPVKEDDD